MTPVRGAGSVQGTLNFVSVFRSVFHLGIGHRPALRDAEIFDILPTRMERQALRVA
jgi:hypothetical protein